MTRHVNQHLRWFDDVLIANRGEIVERIARTARRMGLRTVAVYSDADRHAPYLEACDESLPIGGDRPAESYLDIDKLIDAARRSRVQAIHPGYGFLSESAAFAQAVLDAGLVWIGPSPETMQAMGDKANARRLMQQVGVPVLPGTDAFDDLEPLLRLANDVGMPLMVKAAAGGGGRGMRWVKQLSDLPEALATAQAEARAAFGDGRLLLERALHQPRHVEVQVLADGYGRVVHLGERDCSVQRRHQKLIEEAPSPRVDAVLRRRMGEMAIQVARSASASGYLGAGTVEFLVNAEGAFWFMEMNTRLQVEHPVTECLTGLDLVEWQCRIARGEPLTLDQDALLKRMESSGHAIEARLCAEDPARSHLPQAGQLRRWQEPPGLRVDAALRSGQTISPFYDTMLGKLIAHGPSRKQALDQLRYGLAQTVCLGVTTNRGHLARMLDHPVFRAGDAHTGFVDDTPEVLQAPLRDVMALEALAVVARVVMPDRSGPPHSLGWHSSHRIEREVVIQSGDQRRSWQVVGEGLNLDAWRVSQGDQQWTLTAWRMIDPHACQAQVNGELLRAQIHRHGRAFWMQSGDVTFEGEDVSLEPLQRKDSLSDGCLRAPMHGRVEQVAVSVGDIVQAGDLLVVLEAMKIAHRLCAPVAGRVSELSVQTGQQVAMRQVLAQIQIGA